jgi:hypothetical protein
LSGATRTFTGQRGMAEFDPERTSISLQIYLLDPRRRLPSAN